MKASARDRDRRSHQILRTSFGAGRVPPETASGVDVAAYPGAGIARYRCSRGRNIRVPGTERLRKEHDDSPAARVSSSDGRTGARARTRHGTRQRDDSPSAGVPAKRNRALRHAHGRTTARLPGRAERPPGRAPRGIVPTAGAFGAHVEATRPRLLARHAPEGRHRPGAPARSGACDSRRADRGTRPAHAACVLRNPRHP